MDPYQISLIISFALAIAELMTLSFLLLGFSIGMLAVSGVQFLFNGYSLNRDLMVFALVSMISFWVFRKLFKKTSDLKVLAEDDINQY
ncbi:MAG: hypothetical protein EBT67_09745 [Betaproteobacteria bacterium]|jgi:membrane protein implicated in regulation of membrane protease activity|nr:hypothetical protein [Betaproteobacteria bacterium]